MKPILLSEHITDFIDDYDAFIIDLWGVIHDGTTLYPHVKKALEQIHQAGKKIVFLSNAPRRSGKVIEVLSKFGIERHLYQDALSSGEVFYDYMAEKALKNRYLYIGPEKDRDILEGLPYVMTEDAQQADFGVITGFDKDDSTIEEKMPQLEASLQAKLTLYCINPDMVVVKQTGERALCAGVLAAEYKKMGGSIVYFGKPFHSVYAACLAKLVGTDKHRIVAIGDSLDTDIKGAAMAGIDSVLIMEGILKAQIENDPARLQVVCETHGIFPKRAMPCLR